MARKLKKYLKKRITLLNIRVFLYSIIRFCFCCFNFKKRRKKLIDKNRKAHNFMYAVEYIENCDGIIETPDCNRLIQEFEMKKI